MASNNDIKKDLTRDERIKKELNKLRKIYSDLDDKTKKAAEKLQDNACFMAIALEDLQEEIKNKGYVEEYQNGANQKGYKECSEVKIYNSMIKNYMSIVKQLTDLLPKTVLVDNKSNDDGFDSFISGRGNS